ncbi:MAG: thioesterase family protein, partial [Acidimicrobiia bacterium]|nr:thioesterase family protein [Acidimicrobiia bacterium]
LDGVLACLEVERVEGDRWRAPNLEMDYRRIFGGQLLAQAIALGHATDPEKVVKSISVLFPREGSLDEPLVFDVEATQTGRTFSARRISAAQHDKVFFVAQLSMHQAGEAGLDHQDERPDVGRPDDAAPTELGMIPWECRVVDDVDLTDRSAGPADFAFWTRLPPGSVGDDETTRQALLAYATDLTVIGTALRPHEGYSQADSTVTLHTAVTSHQLWFHRPVRLDRWCLITQHAPVTAGGRAFGHGHVFDEQGALVASFAQESMIRLLPGD